MAMNIIITQEVIYEYTMLTYCL